MQTNRKSLGIIIIILGFIILGLIIYFGFILRDKNQEPLQTEKLPEITNQLPAGEETPTTTPGDRPRNYQQYDISQEAEHKINRTDVIKLAESFAERLGSFSNYSNYSNFSDLSIFMTDNMKTWADDYVAELRANTKNNEEYYGITTVALTGQAVSYDEEAGTAKIIVVTQRRESTGQANEGQAYNQNIEITLKKVNGDWLVDKAYWVK